MSLVIPQSNWSQYTTNLTGTPSATPGTLVTASATPNTDGTSVSLITAITHHVQFLTVWVNSSAASSTNTNMLLDILVDPAGGTSWATAPIINDLLAGYASTPAGGPGRYYNFPVYIPSGASIGARVRAAVASRTVRVVVHAYGGLNPPDGVWYGQTVETIGVTAASSTGQNHTAGNTGAFSAWTNLGSTLTQDCGALQFGIGGGGSTAVGAVFYHFQIGVGSTQIGPSVYVNGDSGEIIMPTATGPVFQYLPSGTQLQVRGTCSGTAVAVDIAAYAVE